MTLVRLEPTTPWSRVKHSSTEPLHSLCTHAMFYLTVSAGTSYIQKHLDEISLDQYCCQGNQWRLRSTWPFSHSDQSFMSICNGLFYSLSWNVIHPDTKTNILMKSSLTNTVAKASSEWQLEYLTSRSGKKMITLKTDVNKEKPEFNIEVSRKEPFLSIFMCRSRGVRTPPEKITSGHMFP